MLRHERKIWDDEKGMPMDVLKMISSFVTPTEAVVRARMKEVLKQLPSFECWSCHKWTWLTGHGYLGRDENDNRTYGSYHECYTCMYERSSDWMTSCQYPYTHYQEKAQREQHRNYRQRMLRLKFKKRNPHIDLSAKPDCYLYFYSPSRAKRYRRSDYTDEELGPGWKFWHKMERAEMARWMEEREALEDAEESDDDMPELELRAE